MMGQTGGHAGPDQNMPGHAA